MTSYDVFTSNLARAGRARVGISTCYIADETGIDPESIWQLERAIIFLPNEQQEAIKNILMDYGALFLPDSEAGGYGVRLKYSRARANQINRWEAEGGPAGEDDV